MNKKTPLVSIVIPTHNRKKSAERLIISVINNTYKNVEIIVIDDASNDGSNKYLSDRFKNTKNVKVIKNKKNLFTAESRNVGLRISKGKFTFFIDDDNVLGKNAILELVAVFLKDKKIGELGPVNYNFNKKKKILWFITRRNMFTTKTYQPRNISEVAGKKIWSTADIPNAFMVRNSIVKDNKIYFEKYYGIMYEESDFAYKIRNLGYKVMVVKSAKIYHDIEISEKGQKNKDYMFHFMEDNRRPYVFGRNRIIFHSIYSNKIQFFFILIFWNWFFTCYYLYKIIFYSGVGTFSVSRRLSLGFNYLRGVIEGIVFVFSKNL